MSANQLPTKYYYTELPLHAHLLLLPIYIVPVQGYSYYAHLRTRTLMYTELCVYLGEGIFTMIVSVNFHGNQSSQSGAKYDDTLMNTNIVLHESVENQ